jgi:hypothetical protein
VSLTRRLKQSIVTAIMLTFLTAVNYVSKSLRDNATDPYSAKNLLILTSRVDCGEVAES